MIKNTNMLSEYVLRHWIREAVVTAHLFTNVPLQRATKRGGCNRLPPHNYLRMGRIVVEGRTSKYDGALHSDCDVMAMRGKNEGEE
jgi:hypothetical protein